MKPIEFRESNHIYDQSGDPSVFPTPVYKADDREGHIVLCQGLSLWERLKLLWLGRIWVCYKTEHLPLPPSYFTVNKKELLDNQS